MIGWRSVRLLVPVLGLGAIARSRLSLGQERPALLASSRVTIPSRPGLVAVLLLLVLTGVNAAAQDSPPWSSVYTDVTWTGGGIADGVEGSLIVPLLADEDEWLFADLRGKTFDNASHEGNWGIGYRRWTDSDWIIGGYGFYDLRETPFGNNFWQVTVGLEAKSYVWDFRANGYIAEDGVKGTSSGTAVRCDDQQQQRRRRYPGWRLLQRRHDERDDQRQHDHGGRGLQRDPCSGEWLRRTESERLWQRAGRRSRHDQPERDRSDQRDQRHTAQRRSARHTQRDPAWQCFHQRHGQLQPARPAHAVISEDRRMTHSTVVLRCTQALHGLLNAP